MPYWNEELQTWGWLYYEEGPSSFQYLGVRRDMTVTKEELENRYSYHAPQGTQAERYGKIRAKCLELAELIVENTPYSREQSSALTWLDNVMFHANAAIARNE
jgi:hypothetical protein